MPFAKLNRQSIVEEALAILDQDGLDQVSLRKVAGRMDVSVSSLYRHVEDRDQLLTLMAVTIFDRCLASVAAADRWQQWVRNYADALWRTQHAVRDCQRLIFHAASRAGSREDIASLVAPRLVALGVRFDRAWLIQQSIHALVTGWSTLKPEAEDRDLFDEALEALIAGWAARGDIPG